MEFAVKPAKPSSNISEIVSKFAKLCRLRSIGVISSEDPNNYHPHPHKHEHRLPKGGNNVSLAEDSRETIKEEGCNVLKVHPKPVEMHKKGKECGHVDIWKLFDAVSVLKLAYVQLQEAHIPYDPEKIKTANELVVTQLEDLCKIKRTYKEKQFKKKNSISSCSALLLGEIEVQVRVLEELKSQLKGKEAELNYLQLELCDLDVTNRKLDEELSRRERASVRLMKPSSVEEIVNAVSKAIHDFAKPLIALMKISGWDLDRAANAIEESVVYSKRSHKKYAFEAYIARRMFYGISQSDNVTDIIKFDDPFDALIEDPDSNFGEFCKAKYLLVVHPKMEASFFGNLDHRVFVSKGRHPRTPFYQAFVKMARWVWALQGIAASIGSAAEIFGVNRGQEFSDVYMECVEEQMETMSMFGEEARFKVELMVMPGIINGEKIVRSRVYLSKMRSS